MKRVVTGVPRHREHQGHDDDGDTDREEREEQQSLNLNERVKPERQHALRVYLGEENDIRCLCEGLKYLIRLKTSINYNNAGSTKFHMGLRLTADISH